MLCPLEELELNYMKQADNVHDKQQRKHEYIKATCDVNFMFLHLQGASILLVQH